MKRPNIKKTVGFSAFFSGAFLPALIVNGPAGYLPGLFALLTAAACWCYTRWAGHALQWEEAFPEGDVPRGSKLQFSISLHSTSFLPCPRIQAVFASDGGEQTAACTLPPRGSRTLCFSASFPHVGSFPVGLRELRVEDPLGLFRRVLPNQDRRTVEITPRIINFEQTDAIDAAQSEQNCLSAAANAGSDYIGVREYQPGDPMKQIHWKLSSRTGALHTKLYESSASNGICVLLDLELPDSPLETRRQLYDGLVETALSLAHDAKRKRIGYTVLYPQNGEPSVFRPPHFYTLGGLIKDLPRENPGARLLPNAYTANLGEGRLLYCTASLDGEKTEGLLQAGRQRLNPVVYYICPQRQTSGEHARALAPIRILEAGHVPCHLLYAADDLQKVG